MTLKIRKLFNMSKKMSFLIPLWEKKKGLENDFMGAMEKKRPLISWVGFMLGKNGYLSTTKEMFCTFGATNEGQPKSAVASHPSNVPSVRWNAVAGRKKDLLVCGYFSGEGDKRR